MTLHRVTRPNKWGALDVRCSACRAVDGQHCNLRDEWGDRYFHRVRVDDAAMLDWRQPMRSGKAVA